MVVSNHTQQPLFPGLVDASGEFIGKQPAVLQKLYRSVGISLSKSELSRTLDILTSQNIRGLVNDNRPKQIETMLNNIPKESLKTEQVSNLAQIFKTLVEGSRSFGVDESFIADVGTVEKALVDFAIKNNFQNDHARVGLVTALKKIVPTPITVDNIGEIENKYEMAKENRKAYSRLLSSLFKEGDKHVKSEIIDILGSKSQPVNGSKRPFFEPLDFVLDATPLLDDPISGKAILEILESKPDSLITRKFLEVAYPRLKNQDVLEALAPIIIEQGDDDFIQTIYRESRSGQSPFFGREYDERNFDVNENAANCLVKAMPENTTHTRLSNLFGQGVADREFSLRAPTQSNLPQPDRIELSATAADLKNATADNIEISFGPQTLTGHNLTQPHILGLINALNIEDDISSALKNALLPKATYENNELVVQSSTGPIKFDFETGVFRHRFDNLNIGLLCLEAVRESKNIPEDIKARVNEAVFKTSRSAGSDETFISLPIASETGKAKEMKIKDDGTVKFDRNGWRDIREPEEWALLQYLDLPRTVTSRDILSKHIEVITGDNILRITNPKGSRNSVDFNYKDGEIEGNYPDTSFLPLVMYLKAEPRFSDGQVSKDLLSTLPFDVSIKDEK